MTLTPAYGRDYKSGKEAKAAFDAGVDFRIATVGPDDGRYVTKSELPKGTSVQLRFKRLTGVTVVKA